MFRMTSIEDNEGRIGADALRSAKSAFSLLMNDLPDYRGLILKQKEAQGVYDSRSHGPTSPLTAIFNSRNRRPQGMLEALRICWR